MKTLDWCIATVVVFLSAYTASIVMSDQFAIYDQGLLLVSVVWLIVNWSVMKNQSLVTLIPGHSWLVHHGLKSPTLFLSGIGILGFVTIRHAMQIHLFIDDYYMHPESEQLLSRHAQSLLVLWVIGWGALLLSVWPTISYQQVWRKHHREALVICSLVAIATLLRFYDLGLTPNIMNGDEGLIGWWAVSLMRIKGAFSFVFGAIDGVGTTYLYISAGIYQVFGQNAMTARILPACAGVISILTNYWLARQLFGQRVALITAVLLVFAHTHIHFSRQLAVSYIYSTAFIPVYLWGVWRVVETKRLWPAMVAAFGVMLHVNFYLDAWAWAVFLIILVSVWAIVDRQTIIAAAQPLVFMFCMIIFGILPMILWARNYPGEFMSRMSADGSITTGWLAREAELYGVSQAYILFTLFEAAILAFLTKPFTDFYHAEVPILDAISAVLFVVGMVLVHFQFRSRRMLLLLGWFWGGVTALAILTVPISTYHYRLFAVVPVVYILIAYTYDVILTKLSPIVGTRSMNVILACIVILFALQNVAIYRTQLAHVCRYGGDLRTQQAGVLSNYLYKRNTPQATVLVYGNMDEFHYGPWKTMDFMNPQMRYVNADLTTDPTGYLDTDRPVYVIVVPERHYMIKSLASQYRADTVYNLLHCGEPVLYAFEAK